MKLRYLLKLIQQGSISIIVPNKFEGILLQHRIGNTEVKIIPVDKWTMADLTYNIVIEFPNDIPTSTLQIIEQSAANVIYSEEIL